MVVIGETFIPGHDVRADNIALAENGVDLAIVLSRDGEVVACAMLDPVEAIGLAKTLRTRALEMIATSATAAGVSEELQ